MAPKKPKNPTNRDILTEVQGLKGMVANQGKTLRDHSDRLSSLEEHNKNEAIAKRAAKEAVEQYKRTESETAKKLPDNQWLTKELLSVIIKLIAVIAALVAALKVGGTFGK